MKEVEITVHPFRMDTDKGAALKPLEESAEVYGAFHEVTACGTSDVCKSCTLKDVTGCMGYVDLGEEIADCITACVNLADRYGIDLQDAISRVEQRNRIRGRYADE